jgi:hypothetical protein
MPFTIVLDNLRSAEISGIRRERRGGRFATRAAPADFCTATRDSLITAHSRKIIRRDAYTTTLSPFQARSASLLLERSRRLFY